MKASDLRQRWDGLKTCTEDWEPRQPQDFVRGVADYQAPPWTRAEPANNFIDVTQSQWLQTFTQSLTSLKLKVHHLLQYLTVKAVSTVTTVLTTIYIPRPPRTAKGINGAALNTVTLG
jgi:hypothetical protein